MFADDDCGAGEPRAGVEYRGEAEGPIGAWVCAAALETKFCVRSRDAWMFFVRTSRTSLKFADTSVSLPWRRKTTFLLCSPSWSAPLFEGCKDLERDWREEICWFKLDKSCLIIKVNSLISTGRSSNSVFRFATAAC